MPGFNLYFELMTLYEGFSVDIPHVPPRNEELEARRRVFAEERTGEIVIKVGSVGYVALSEHYRVEHVTETALEAVSSFTPEQMVQLPLLQFPEL